MLSRFQLQDHAAGVGGRIYYPRSRCLQNGALSEMCIVCSRHCWSLKVTMQPVDIWDSVVMRMPSSELTYIIVQISPWQETTPLMWPHKAWYNSDNSVLDESGVQYVLFWLCATFWFPMTNTGSAAAAHLVLENSPEPAIKDAIDDKVEGVLADNKYCGNTAGHFVAKRVQ